MNNSVCAVVIKSNQLKYSSFMGHGLLSAWDVSPRVHTVTFAPVLSAYGLEIQGRLEKL